MDDAFRHLVDAAQGRDVKIIAVTSVDSKQVVLDTLTERFGADVTEYAVVPLTDTETAITEYVVHYHTERNHQGLGNELLTPLPASANDAGPIVSRERLGGILNYYCRAA